MEANEKKKIKNPKLIAVIVAVIAVLAIVLRACSGGKQVESKPLSTVSVGHAETGSIAVETSLVGTVEPGDVYYVTPKVSGEILNIYVNAGDTVNEGDPICDIDNSKAVDGAKIALDSAKVQLKTATEARDLAKTNLDRMQTLLSSGDISQQSFESTKNGYDQAVAAVDGAKLQLESAQLQYDTQVEFSTVTAPVNGVVESTNMSINAMAAQGSQVCVISSNSANKAVFYLTDRLLAELSEGDRIQIKKQGTVYDGHITKLETLPNQTTGLYEAEAEFSGSEAVARGAKVKVFFDAEKADNVMLVDTDSIYYDGGKTYIYTVTYNDESEESSDGASVAEGNRAGTIHKNEVETGISNTDKTEVIKGIEKDSIVVKTWTSQLYEGAQVQVLPEED